jgi:large subunit ribosomal protein L4
VVLERGDNLTWLSLRNVDTVHLLAVDQLNTYDVLLCDDVVFTKAAYDTFVGARGGEGRTEAPSVAPSEAPVAEQAEAPQQAEPADESQTDTSEEAAE